MDALEKRNSFSRNSIQSICGLTLSQFVAKCKFHFGDYQPSMHTDISLKVCFVYTWCASPSRYCVHFYLLSLYTRLIVIQRASLQRKCCPESLGRLCG